MISISIIIPIYNEEKTILKILNKINDLKKDLKIEIIVVNDGSIDSSKKIIEKNTNLYQKFLHLEKNQGKGKAIIEGLKIASYEYVFFQDADLEYDPNDLKKFIKIVKNQNADLILGSRFIGEQRSVLNFWHSVGNKFITFLFNLLNNSTFTDIYCCHCLFKRNHLDALNLKSFGWGQQAEILTYLINKSIKTYETSVNYDARKHSEGKKIRYYNVFEVIYWIVITKVKILFR